MTVRQKQQPEPLFESESLSLKEALARAAKGEIDEDLSISFRVAGGVAEQHYRLVLQTTGGRLDSCVLDCVTTDRHGDVGDREIDPKTLSSLGRSLLRSEFLNSKTEPPRFLPDTLVGIIEITSGDITHRVYYAADPDQAAVQGKAPPAAVLEAAEALYTAAGKILQIENVRP